MTMSCRFWRAMDQAERQLCRYTQSQLPKPATPHPVWKEDPTTFYANPYWVDRQLWHRQNDSYAHIASVMGNEGILFEYGCGIAPVSWYLAPKFPKWLFILQDLGDTPQLQYGVKRLRTTGVQTFIHSPDFFFQRPNVIVAFEVFEHLPDPKDTASWLCAILEPNGHLFVTYDECTPDNENLCRDLADTIATFEINLTRCCDGEYKHYVNT